MTTFLLVRHAAHVLGGDVIAGRSPEAHLSREGRAQAERLAARLSSLPIRAVFASPIRRAHETAEPLADRLGLSVRLDDALAEIDYGEWTGGRFDELARRPRWRRWNQFRSGTAVPGGESMLEVQARVVGALLRLRDEHPTACLAVVSHGDPIKSAIAYFLGVPLDLSRRIEIGLASVSVLALDDDGARVPCVNHSGLELPSSASRRVNTAR